MILELQYFDYMMQSAESLEKTVMLGKIEGKRRGWERMTWLNGIILNTMDMSLSKHQEIDSNTKSASVHGVTESDTTLNKQKHNIHQ